MARCGGARNDEGGVADRHADRGAAAHPTRRDASRPDPLHWSPTTRSARPTAARRWRGRIWRAAGASPRWRAPSACTTAPSAAPPAAPRPRCVNARPDPMIEAFADARPPRRAPAPRTVRGRSPRARSPRKKYRNEPIFRRLPPRSAENEPNSKPIASAPAATMEQYRNCTARRQVRQVLQRHRPTSCDPRLIERTIIETSSEAGLTGEARMAHARLALSQTMRRTPAQCCIGRCLNTRPDPRVRRGTMGRNSSPMPHRQVRRCKT